MCIFNAIGTRVSDQYYLERGSYWTLNANTSLNGLIGFAYAMITYQNIVPISLYISIEFVRTLQAYFIWADDEITDNDRRTLARSWNLSDDLGQIQYVFSDKTGTLTQNLMQFRQCSVAGKVYRGRQQLGSLGEEEDGEWEEEEEKTIVNGENNPSGNKKANRTTPQTKSNESAKLDEKPSGKSKSGSSTAQAFKDNELMKDLAEVDSDQARSLHGFFACLALCHTVLVSEDEEGSIKYKAQSPDEQALVQAAAAVGFVFRGRDKNILRLQVPSQHLHDQSSPSSTEQTTEIKEVGSSEGHRQTVEVNDYELLEVIEFTSARKRMSVVVRRLIDGEPEPGELYLLVKGADNVIFERLGSGQDELKQTTDDQLEQFASEGLRTLCLAYRKLELSELEAWQRKYTHACSQIGSNRDKLIDQVQDELERDLILIGATAIEDKLQEGVPRAIADLKRAGIKVWVATGDKLETAVGEHFPSPV
jgi:phospholipid-translocating ATPase